MGHGSKPSWVSQRETAHAQDAARQADLRARAVVEHSQARFDALISELATFTEWQLATLEQLQSRKRTAKCDISRQQEIVDGMVIALRKQGFNPHNEAGMPQLPRLAEIIPKV